MIVLPLRHELACDADAYWACVLDRDYNRALFVETLRFGRYDVLEQRERARSVSRRVRAESTRVGVPGILHRYLAYVEEGDLDRERSLYTFRCINEAAPGRVDVRGYIHAQQLRTGRCVRTCEIHIDVTLLGLGAWVERRMAEDLKRAYAVSADLTDAWVRRMPKEARA